MKKETYIYVKAFEELLKIFLENDLDKRNIVLPEQTGFLISDYADIDQENWDRFCKALGTNTSVKTLNFKQFSHLADPGSIDSLRWINFCRALSSNKSITTLEMPYFHFSIYPWRAFWNCIERTTTIQALNLCTFELGPPLYEWDMQQSWKLFRDRLAINKSLTELNLSWSKLDRMNYDDDFENLCAGLKRSSIRKLDLSGIPFFDTKKLNFIRDVIKYNKSIIHFRWNPAFATDQSEEIAQIIKDRQIEHHEPLLFTAYALKKRFISDRLGQHILSFITPYKPLAKQVLQEIDVHLENVAKRRT